MRTGVLFYFLSFLFQSECLIKYYRIFSNRHLSRAKHQLWTRHFQVALVAGLLMIDVWLLRNATLEVACQYFLDTNWWLLWLVSVDCYVCSFMASPGQLEKLRWRYPSPDENSRIEESLTWQNTTSSAIAPLVRSYLYIYICQCEKSQTLWIRTVFNGIVLGEHI